MHSVIEAEFDLIRLRIYADLIRQVVAAPAKLPVVLSPRLTVILTSGG